MYTFLTPLFILIIINVFVSRLVFFSGYDLFFTQFFSKFGNFLNITTYIIS